MSTNARTSAVRRSAYAGVLFVLPAVVVVLAIIAYPLGQAIWLSLTDKQVGSAGHFVGFENYATLFRNATYLKTIRNTFVYTFGGLVVKLVFGMWMALALNKLKKGRDVLGAVLLLPWIIPTVISTLIWAWMFDSSNGVINYMLLHLHLIKKPVAWLATSGWAMTSVIIVSAWREIPYFALSILAGLKGIPVEQYEAAALDGANAVQTFRYVTIPNLQGILLLISTLSVIQSAYDFSVVYILTRGGPVNATQLFSTLSFQTAFQAGQMGRAVAIALTAFPIFAPLVLYVTRLLQKQGAQA
jgi:multiple sugar transport system permease protein